MSEENKKSSNDTKKGFSRRSFIRGAGLATAGTVFLQNSVMAMEENIKSATGKSYGPEHVSIQLNVNGKIHTILAEPRDTLAHVLRHQLELTGTKVVCDRGSCSACTVWLDGKPVNSCMTMALDVGNKEVTTIEGIAENGELHPIQEAFIEHDASQCGYCTPGMIMTGVHFLKENPDPTPEEVKRAYRGNLCRCGTYPHVFKATLTAAKKMK